MLRAVPFRPLLSRPILFRSILSSPRHNINTHTRQLDTTTAKLRNLPGLGVLSGSVLLALGLSPFYPSHIYSDTQQQQQAVSPPDNEFYDVSLGALVRSYVVYTMCSIPSLVDNSPRLLELASLPGIRWIAETFVRITFFDHFVGGDTAQETLPLLYKLRAANKGALLSYSVEVGEAGASSSLSSRSKSEETAPHKRFVDELIHGVDVSASFEDHVAGGLHTPRRTWVVIKMSALLRDSRDLVKLSSYILSTRPALQTPVLFPGFPRHSDLDILFDPPPTSKPDGLTPEVIASLRELYADLVKICSHAQEKGVKITIDAEYSWYQPAIDALTLALTREFNKLPPQSAKKDPDSSRLAPTLPNIQPLVYGTYQAYLRRTPGQLALALQDAKAHNYALGVKLVRGAYHPYEIAAHEARLANRPSISIGEEEDKEPPVWMTKQETDECYDGCVRVLVGAVKDDVDACTEKGRNVPGLGVLFGTHNWGSCEIVLGELVRSGLAKEGGAMGDEEKKVVLGNDVIERVAIGQLFGMSDDLTNWLVRRTFSGTPFIIKYIPYGSLSEVMPYLGRRAIENKSVLGEGIAIKERRRAGKEIRKRIGLGFLG